MTDERLPAVVGVHGGRRGCWHGTAPATRFGSWRKACQFASPEHRAGSFESLAERLIKDAKHIRAGGTFERAKTH